MTKHSENLRSIAQNDYMSPNGKFFESGTQLNEAADAFDDMLAALREAADALEAEYEDRAMPPVIVDMIARHRAAISKAEGKP